MLLLWHHLFPIINVNVLRSSTGTGSLRLVLMGELGPSFPQQLTSEFPLSAEFVLEKEKRAEQPGQH